MGPADPHGGVGDSLQADVMRFMAIIAFCLMAILALVRSADQVPTAAPAPDPASTATSLAAVSEDARPAVPEPAAPQRPVERPEQPARRLAETSRAPVAQPRVSVERPQASMEPPQQLSEPPPPASEARDEPREERGLHLRFASESDFLRLVNQGKVRLYAFREGEVLSVSNDFRLQPAAAPGALHELLPQTIPGLMADALRGRAPRDDAGEFRWGIVMPDRMARQVRGYVEQGASGELVIDRFGEVRHREV